jgi:hypothetical protein
MPFLALGAATCVAQHQDTITAFNEYINHDLLEQLSSPPPVFFGSSLAAHRHTPNSQAITTTLHDRITSFAQMIKVYRAPQDGEKRYSPAEVQSVEVIPVCGQPAQERICTSIVERSNVSLRMGLRRFTRLTNAFSKKWENHAAAVMLWYCWYNFGRVHKTLRVTPAMAAGIADHVWSVRELLETN